MMVSKPPPNRNTANATTIIVKVVADGFDDESLRNQRLSEKDIDEACFLTFLDIFKFLFVNQVILSPYLFTGSL